MINDLPVRLHAFEAESIFAELRRRSQTIAFANGCFDPLHYGHIKTLKFAKSISGVLVVAVNSDKSIQKIKGSDRPRIPLDQRVSALAELRCVDFIVDYDETTATDLIRALRPNFVVKGSEYDRSTTLETPIIQEVGAELIFADYVHGVSSTRLVDSSRFSDANARRTHLITDLALDTYLIAEANTLSREFPNLVCVNPKERSALGGGGNLAVSLNRQCLLSSISSVVGSSTTDDLICELIRGVGVGDLNLVHVGYPYCTRYRKVIGKRQASTSQELLRLDEIQVRPNMESVWKSISKSISLSQVEKGDVIVMSAYEDPSRSTVGSPIRPFLRDFSTERGAILIGACRSACTSLHGFDYVVVNELECLQSLSIDDERETVTVDMARELAKLVCPSQVVITMGERGAMLCSSAKSDVFTVNTTPCPPGTDPTGAGDVFLAVFTSAISRGFTSEDCTEIAVHAATKALFGAQRPAVAEPFLV